MVRNQNLIILIVFTMPGMLDGDREGNMSINKKIQFFKVGFFLTIILHFAILH